jgi:hypothetical protein
VSPVSEIVLVLIATLDDRIGDFDIDDTPALSELERSATVRNLLEADGQFRQFIGKSVSIVGAVATGEELAAMFAAALGREGRLPTDDRRSDAGVRAARRHRALSISLPDWTSDR